MKLKGNSRLYVQEDAEQQHWNSKNLLSLRGVAADVYSALPTLPSSASIGQADSSSDIDPYAMYII